MQKLYNNAAQAWNHNFYWNGFVPASESKMPAELEELLTEAFGSVENFKNELVTKASVNSAAAGFGWFSMKANCQFIPPNGVNPWKDGKFPVFVLDVGSTPIILTTKPAQEASRRSAQSHRQPGQCPQIDQEIPGRIISPSY